MVESILQQALAAGINLYLEDGKLKFTAPKGAMTPTLKSLIGGNKEAIIAYLNSLSVLEQAGAQPEISPRQHQHEWPLSYAQSRLWFLNKLADGNSAEYNLSTALILEGAVSLELFQAVLTDIVVRHEILRCQYVESDGVLQQSLVPVEQVNLTVPVLDIRDLSANEQEQRLQQAIQYDATQPFDLSKDLMVRMQVVKLSPHQQDRHAVLFSMHHIASDGWSVELLIEEFMTLYQQRLDSSKPSLAPLSLQYADYADWQQTRLNSDITEQQLAWWTEQLRDIPDVHRLPLDKVRPPVQQFDSTELHVPLNAQFSQRITEFAKARNVTVFMLLQTVFALVLSRFSHSRDIVMATPVSGREQQQFQSLIGCFLNTLALRTEFKEDETFSQLLTRNQQTIQDAFAHQDVPFDLLVEKLSPNRSMAYNPICQVKFVLQNIKQQTFSLPGLTVAPIKPAVSFVRYDLDLSVTEEAEGFQLNWNAKNSLFEKAGIQRLSDSFVFLLQQVCESPDQSVMDLPLFDSAERQRLIGLGQGKPLPVDTAHLLPERILRQAGQTPDAIAVRSVDRTLTYAQLAKKARCLAGYLLEQDIEPGDKVPVMPGRDTDLLIAYLGVMLSGAAYVPLDTKSTATRTQAIIQDTDAELVVTNSKALSVLPLDGIDLLMMDDSDDDDWLEEYADDELPVLDATNPAYVIYTSGSTGVPKGVVIAHRGLLDYCEFSLGHYFHTPEQSALAGSLLVTEPVFDISVPSLYLPLMQGSCVHILADDDPVQALATSLRQAETAKTSFLIRMTPTHCQALFYLLNDTVIEQQHALVVGGEAMPNVVAKQLLKTFPNASIYNHYGPSETVVGCCICDLRTISDDLQHIVPVGQAMANTHLLVLDEQQQLVPQGALGELWIGGDGVATGYLNRPALNERHFVSDVLKLGVATRYYRTGDLARWNVAGLLEFIGRTDQQVKLRGYRIELGEIDAQLVKCAGVKLLATAIKGDADNQNQALICYFTRGDIEGDLATQLKQFAQSALPDYMVPSRFIELDVMPVNRIGKLDRRALPEPDSLAVSQDIILASTDTELMLSQIWCELLNIPQASIHDDFFALGGHSLLATRLISEISQRLGKTLLLKDVFDVRTLQQMAEKIDSLAAVDQPEIEVLSDDAIKPLSWSQRRLWLLSQIEPDVGQYNMPALLNIEGRFVPERAEQALNQLLHRHSVLATGFKTLPANIAANLTENETRNSDDPALITHQRSLVIEQTDLSSLSAAAQQEEINRLVHEQVNRPFDLANDLLLRACWIQTHATEQASSGLLLVTTHHIAADGWSLEILMRDFIALYHAEPLPELSITFADYAAWQQSQLSDVVLQEYMDYWQQWLGDIEPVHQLPTRVDRSKVEHFTGENLTARLSNTQLNGLKQLALAHNTTLFMVLHGVFSLLIARHSQQQAHQQQVVIGTPVANRHSTQLNDIVGFFINNLVLKTDVDLTASFTDYLAQVKQINLEALSRQQTPFEYLVEKLAPTRSIHHSPLFQIMLILNNNQEFSLSADDFSVTPVPLPESVAKYELTLHAREADGELLLNLEYRTALFHGRYMQDMLSQFVHLVDDIIAAPDRALGEYSLLPPDQTKELLHALNQTGLAVDFSDAIHHRIERCASVYPERTAIVFDGEALSYQALNQHANQLAHRLIADGVNPGDIVGLCTERSLDMMIGLLGILKAGAAYVPLDPSFPITRLNFIIVDTGLTHLITQSSVLPLLDISPQHQVICLDSEQVSLQPFATENPAGLMQADGQSLAYIIYTSGSTGQPKGVKVSHRNAINFFAAMDQQFRSTEDKDANRWLALTSISFDISLLELFWTLTHGDYVVIQPDRPQMNQQFNLSGPVSVVCEAADLAPTAQLIKLTADETQTLLATEESEQLLALNRYLSSTDTHSSMAVQRKETDALVSETVILLSPVADQPESHLLALAQRLNRYLEQLVCKQQLIALRQDRQWSPFELVRQNNISHMQCTPTFIREWVNDPAGIAALQQLECLLVGGEPLSGDLAQKLASLVKGRVFNMYGPTETTVWSAVAEITNSDVTVGRPIANTQLYITDQQGQLLPRGVTGELCIGGEGVTQGYLNRDELTAEKFIISSFNDSLVYRTGDIARYDEDGRVRLSGRSDEQVKINGYRIELGEVEALLRQLPGVSNAAAIAKEREHGAGFGLYAFVTTTESVASEHQASWCEQLLQQLALSAPSQFVPEQIVLETEFPTTANGKTDKKALAANLSPQFNQRIDASTDTERALESIWQTVLGRHEALSVTTSFFTLGGHSLLAVRLANEIAAQFSCDCTVKDIFAFSTIQQLASRVDQLTRTEHRTVLTIPKAASQADYPLSTQQQRLWFIDQMQQGRSTQYNMQSVLRFDGVFKLDVAEKAFEWLIDRHLTLRTVFAEQRQRILLVEPFKIQRLNNTQSLEQLIAEDVAKSFDLSQERPIRASWLQQDASTGFLMLCMHHIATDGWSMNILARDFIVSYQALLAGEEPGLPTLPLDYVDLAQWQQTDAWQQQAKEHEAWWLTQLNGLPERHSLPFDFVPPEQMTFNGATHSLTMTEQEWDGIADFSQQHQITPFILFHSVFSLVLARFSGESDIVIGTPVANREQAELADMVGLLVNTLVLRTDYQADTSVLDYLNEVKNTNLAALSHQDTPFERLVDKLATHRSTSHSPLFQIMLVFNVDAAPEAQLDDVAISTLDTERDQARFELTLRVLRKESNWQLDFNYNTDLFASETIQQLAQSVYLVLNQILANPQQPCSALALTSTTQCHPASAGKRVQQGRDRSVIERFDEQVVRSPASIAVSSGEYSMSYQQLNEFVDQLVATLQPRLTASDRRVAFYLERGPAVLAAMLAAFKLRAAYIPLELSNSPARIQQIIDDAKPDVVLVSPSLASVFDSLNTSSGELMLVDADSVNSVTADIPEIPAIQRATQPDDTAYIMYTSGSTGVPKGVVIPQSALLDYCAYSLNHYYDPAKLDGSLLVTSHGFDISLPALLLPLMTGGVVTIPPSGEELSTLQRLLTEQTSSRYLLRMTPMHVSALLNMVSGMATIEGDLPSFNGEHVFVIGGENFPRSQALSLQNAFPQAQLYNHYGPTEAVVGCCIFDVTAAETIPDTGLPIGQAMENTALYILDDALKPVPKGVAGELYIGGPCLADGYLNLAQQTEKAFIHHPFESGKRLYRTGDRVRQLRDGNLIYLGRQDDQIKLRGFRIEPGEIAQALIQLAEVKDAVVVAQGEGEFKRLVAFVVPTAQEQLTDNTLSDRLIQSLAQKLPDYMLPAVIECLDALPLSANGKVNRRALPAVDLTQQHTFVAAETETEHRIEQLWQTVLQHEGAISVTQDFFSLGGNSLLVMSLVAQIQQSFQITVQIQQLFNWQTIQQQAELIDSLQSLDVMNDDESDDFEDEGAL